MIIKIFMMSNNGNKKIKGIVYESIFAKKLITI